MREKKIGGSGLAAKSSPYFFLGSKVAVVDDADGVVGYAIELRTQSRYFCCCLFPNLNYKKTKLTSTTGVKPRIAFEHISQR